MKPSLFLAFNLGCGVAAQRPAVTLRDATYVGTTTRISTATATATVEKFLGVRFAAKPERFRAAQLPVAGSKTVDAVTQPPACPQQGGSSDSEDCLFLNVFAPQKNSSSPAPKAVMLWFYGGALQGGSISGTDGSSLAANEDVIVVASNYRLGVFGFPGNISGLPANELNPGFRDQKLALRWIQENIANFGGDKTRVTIFGESAGAVSVDSHLMSEPFDNPPFHAAILQSGGLHTFNRVALGVGPYVTGLGTGNKAGEAPFLTLAKALNCGAAEKAVACVQSHTLAEVKSAVQKVNLLFPPVDDNGLSSVGDSDSARRAGRTVNVPVLIGSTFDEGNVFPQNNIASKSLAQWVQLIYPGNSTSQSAVTSAYSVGTSWQIQSASDATHLLHSDYQFACTTTYDSNIISGLGIPTWRYVFNASLPGGRLAGHGSEVGFVFGSSQSAAANQWLSRKMQTAWASFAKNPSAGPGWARYDSKSPSLANLGGEGSRDGITLVDPKVVDSRCSVFTDAYDPNRP